MRILFYSLARPKRIAKLHSRVTGLRLGIAQNEVAYILGYTNWFELHRESGLTVLQQSPDDEDISPAEVQARRSYQASRLREHRLTTGHQSVSHEEALEIIDQVRPSARIPRLERRVSDAGSGSVCFPEALISVLEEAADLGAHKVHVNDKGENCADSGIRYRVHRGLVQGRARTFKEAREIVDWIEKEALPKHASPGTQHGTIRSASLAAGEAFDLGFAWMKVVGGQVAALSIRRQSAAPSLDKLGFMPDQAALLQQHLRSGGVCIVCGTVGNGRHTTIRALTAAYPDVQFHGDIPMDLSWNPDSVFGTISSGIVQTHAVSALAVAKGFFFTLPRERWADLARSRGPSIVIAHQHLLSTLCPHCRIPAASVLSGQKALEIEAVFGIGIEALFVRNETGCKECCTVRRGHPTVPGYAGQRIVAETVTLGEYLSAAIASGEDICSAFRATRRERYDSPDTQGKTAIEVAMYGVANGWFDIRDVENHIEKISWFVGDDPPEYPVRSEATF